jgi:hypothetical protein
LYKCIVLLKAFSEGFPTSGNDTIRDIWAPKLIFEEFLASDGTEKVKGILP